MSVQSPPDWQEILTYFRGSELQNYFTKILEDDLKVGGSTVSSFYQIDLSQVIVILQACIKPQYVDQIPKAVKGTVQTMLDKKDEMKVQEQICDDFGTVHPL